MSDGVVWSWVVSGARLGPAPRPNFNLSLVQKWPTPDHSGVIWKLILELKSSSWVRSNWPPMTMGFKVRDKALFGKLAPGAKIEFDFVQEGEDYVVTALQVR